MGFVENFGNLWKPGVYGGHIISNILEKNVSILPKKKGGKENMTQLMDLKPSISDFR